MRGAGDGSAAWWTGCMRPEARRKGFVRSRCPPPCAAHSLTRERLPLSTDRAPCGAVDRVSYAWKGQGIMHKPPAFGSYQLEGHFVGPQNGLVKPPVFDALVDGRIILSDGQKVYTETARGTRAFTVLRDTGAAGVYTSFIRTSPNGQKVAMGNGASVTVFELAAPSKEKIFPLTNFDAEWFDDKQLVVSGTSTGVSVLHVENGTTTAIIVGIGGAPAGVTLDKEDSLFTGNGYDGDPQTASRTGSIKAFVKDQWMSPLTGGAAIDFEGNGRLVAELLSAASLGFDGEGNLHVGGGEIFSGDAEGPRKHDKNYAALISAAAVIDALSGGLPVVPGSPRSKLHIFDPDKGTDSFYSLGSNRVTRELYMGAYGTPDIHFFRMIDRRDHVLVMTHELHLGDNPGIFSGAAYAGSQIALPMHLNWVTDKPEVRNLRFLFRTREIETWGASSGHPVLINGREIGRLKDTGDQTPEGYETHVISVSKEELLQWAGPTKNFTVTIQLERGVQPGLADDFLLVRTETADFTVKMGWR